MGLTFRNPVGLAAGLDKNGDFINCLTNLGFGFIEIGTVTPLAQPGNDQPRLFRLKHEESLINRMGFNNKGLEHLLNRVKKKLFRHHSWNQYWKKQTHTIALSE
jgi:dihydroorotate dehydrogenase